MKVLIIGAGPAGLTAGKFLTDRQAPFEIVESSSQVGGLAKTIEYKGFRFDIGGHRFFTKMKWVDTFWREILGEQFLKVQRLSRIFHRNRYFYYPLRPWNAFTGLGAWHSLWVVASYLRVKLFPLHNEEYFEPYVINRFGRQLYRSFFKTYTEKLWGIPCTEIKADWASQRIKGLSLMSAALHMVSKTQNRPKTLIEQFDYPSQGPGMVWEALAQTLRTHGCTISLGTRVLKLHHDHSNIQHALVTTADGMKMISATDFLSTMPLRELIYALDPAPPEAILRAAAALRYRDYIAVNLIVNKPALFPDNWLYVHEDNVRVARIQNYKNWSRAMVADPAQTSLGMEYFCSKGDDLWSLSDGELLNLAKQDLETLHLVSPEDVKEGMIHRQAQAYPIYDRDYSTNVSIIRGYLAQFSNLQTLGRNGLHKYNNQDHSMLCARCAVENLYGAENDLWAINTEHEYQEQVLPEHIRLQSAV